MIMLKAGDKAPAFTLLSSDNKEVKLQDFQGGNVVLLFFPKAFTRVCTVELCTMRDDIAYYQGLNAQIVGISVDTPEILADYKQDQHLNFTLLSDIDKTMSTDYGSLYHDEFGNKTVSKRSAFVIDGEGTIRYAEVLENAGELPNFDLVKATIAELN
jgi:glutaredoxin-dependent peroxiredoxin